MKLFRPGLAVGAGLLLAGTAAAQLSPISPYPVRPGLTQEDVARLNAAETRLYEGTGIGTVERWRNPDNGNAGEVRLLRSFTANGRPCRQLEYTVRYTERTALDRFNLTWCRTEDGAWKIADVRPPRK